MVKMQIAGIQIEVNESDADAYVRAGYKLVVELPKQPEPVVIEEEKPEKKTGKK